MGDVISKRLTRLGAQSLAARAELNLGNALSQAGRYKEARPRFVTALESAEGIGDKAAACLGLSSCELFVGKPALAEELADEAFQTYDEFGAERNADICRVNRAFAKLLQGRADESLDELLEVRSRFELTEPYGAWIEELLGDTYGVLNLWSESRDCFQTALAAYRVMRAKPHIANCLYGLGEAHLALGRLSAVHDPISKAKCLYRSMNDRAMMGACALVEARASFEGRCYADASRHSRSAATALSAMKIQPSSA